VKHETHALAIARLFDGRDIEFLRRVPGYGRQVEDEFRRKRCRIFSEYLIGIRTEFLQALAELEDVCQESGYRPANLWGLLRVRLQFAAAMIPANLRLVQYRCKLDPVPLKGVVERFDAILAEVRQWCPQAE
jgi:hypothetical protein